MKRTILILFAFAIMFPWQALKGQGCEDPGDSEDGVRVFGFIQPQYNYIFTDPASNTLTFKRARLGVLGNIPYDFSYYAVLEMSPFVSKTGYPFLLDAFVSYKRYKWFTISMGTFKQPFGLEVATSCSGLHTIERSVVSDQLVSPQRDFGLMFLGGTNETLFRYSVAIMNGSGLGIKDNNTKKDIIGRLTVKPLPFLRFGGSFRYGFPVDNDNSRTSFAGEIEASFGNFLIQGEYIHDQGDYNFAAGGGCGSDPITLGEVRDGAWIHAMYMTPWRVQPVVKFELFDKDKDVEDNSEYITTFGVNYFFNDWTRLQVNYRYRAEMAGEIPNDALLVQVQVKF